MSTFRKCIEFMEEYNNTTKCSECKKLEKQLNSVFDVKEYGFGKYTIQTFLKLFSDFLRKMVLIRKPRSFFRIFKISEFYREVHIYIPKKGNGLDINKILSISMKNKFISNFFANLKKIFREISSKLDDFWTCISILMNHLSTNAYSSLDIDIGTLKKRIILILEVRKEIAPISERFNIRVTTHGTCPEKKMIEDENNYPKLIGYLKSLYKSIPQIVEWTSYIKINERIENNINKFNECIKNGLVTINAKSDKALENIIDRKLKNKKSKI